MTWKSLCHVRLSSCLGAALAAAACSMAGCHECLQPQAVVYPRPPVHGCPPITCAGSVDGPIAAPILEEHPITLPTALELADRQNPEIAVARERIREALAQQRLIELWWIPNIQAGPSWVRHDGQIQRAAGEVFTTSRSSLFVGASAFLNIDTSDALYMPLAARQLTIARQARAEATANERLLDVALAYVDLLQVYGELQINAETRHNARHLLDLTEGFERAGKGAAADTARSRTELELRETERLELDGNVGIVTSRLVQLLDLPPQVQLKPEDTVILPIAIVPEQIPLAELLAQALVNRPELTENRAYIAATLERWRAAKVSPWVPNVQLSYAAGGFGGGMNDFVGDFNGRHDFAATAAWQLNNFGFGDRQIILERQSQYAQANIRQMSIQLDVTQQVLSAFSIAYARRRELETAQRALVAARESYRLNEDRIRRAPEQGRPIELLQALQALARARQDYLRVAMDYNRAQFRLYTALGNPPLCALDNACRLVISEAVVPTSPAPHNAQ